MYKEKFASEIEIGDNVMFGGKYPTQVTGVAIYKNERGENIINLHTATGVYKVHPNQIFQVLIY